MAKLQKIEQQKSLKYLEEVEIVGQNILSLKEERLQYSNAQNKYREALRALEQVTDRDSWFQLGSIYIRRPTKIYKKMLRTELDKTDENLKDLSEVIKENVQKLRDLEYEPRLEGIALKPMSLAETKAIHKAFGTH